MSKVMEHYGKVILTAIVCTALILIFYRIEDNKGNEGVLNIIADNTNVETIDYSIRLDTDASEMTSQRHAPVIMTKDIDRLVTGEIDFNRHIVAYDADGNSIRVKFRRVISPDGVDITDQCSNGIITISKSGKYTLEVYSIDSENTTKTKIVNVTINRRGA